MTTPQDLPASPRMEPWPVAIIAFFVLVVLLAVTFVVWATIQPFDLVTRDYYARELAFQQQIDGTQRAFARPAPVRIGNSPDGLAIDVDFGAPAAAVGAGEIWLYRPSNAAWDRKLALAPGEGGTQRIDAAGLQPGRWRVRIEWTQDGKAFYAEDSVTIGHGP